MTVLPQTPRINSSPVTYNNVGTVRKLNTVLFPVRYSDPFYKTILSPELEDYCRLIYFNDIPVGTACCRLEMGNATGESKLYMMTMGVLAPYRNWKVGSLALKEIITAAASTLTKDTGRITLMYLHVQISNTDARRFYERNGFKLVREIEGYYKKIEPRNAWLLEREITSADVESSAD
ncbi:N-acetyltransferase NAT13 [Clavulina sp. PMI_390]|nr:N-acetyltransferase NAT13 [Clavulina sp. PMI_390]